MQVLAGMFEPIALFDLDVDAAGVDFLRRLESGPVQPFNFLAPPATDDDKLSELLFTYGPYELDMRVVIVEGVAPTFIEDRTTTGATRPPTCEKMGFKLLSNEARLKLVQDFDLLVTETVFGRTCPPPSLIYQDLDGNGSRRRDQLLGVGRSDPGQAPAALTSRSASTRSAWPGFA